jgi:hypothetical protein
VGPFSLLEAVQRHAERFTVFCQPGEIAVPSAKQRVLSLLDKTIWEIAAPNGGVFHPKLWVLRYLTTEDWEDAPPVYRVICASRNLTFDRSWDAMLVLEGELGTKVQTLNHPLSAFIEDLNDQAGRAPEPLDSQRARSLATMVGELPRVDFEPPEHLQLKAFHPLGTTNGSTDPFAGRRDGMLVISPFVGATMLRELAGPGANLISSSAELDTIDPDALSEFEERVWVLSDLALPEPLSADSVVPEREPEDAQSDTKPDSADGCAARERIQDSATGLLRGLHAKVYVANAGHSSRLWVGSANATGAAFGSNVEFLVELEGKSKAKPAAVLGDNESGLLPLLEPYRRRQLEEADEDEREAEFKADSALHQIGSQPCNLHASAQGDGNYALEVREIGSLDEQTHVGAIEIRPASLRADRRLAITDPLLQWNGLELAQVNAFLVLRVTVSVGKARAEREATIRAFMTGVAREERDRAIVRSIIRSPNEFIRYLSFLLADPDRDPIQGPPVGPEPPGPGGPTDPPLLDPRFPVLENLVRAVERDPERLERIARLLKDLSDQDGEESIIPDGFTDIWEPIITAYRELERSE